jgi:hypothetical protein
MRMAVLAVVLLLGGAPAGAVGKSVNHSLF